MPKLAKRWNCDVAVAQSGQIISEGSFFYSPFALSRDFYGAFILHMGYKNLKIGEISRGNTVRHYLTTLCWP